MKKFSLFFGMLLLMGAMCFTSCNKDDDESEGNNGNTSKINLSIDDKKLKVYDIISFYNKDENDFNFQFWFEPSVEPNMIDYYGVDIDLEKISVGEDILPNVWLDFGVWYYSVKFTAKCEYNSKIGKFENFEGHIILKEKNLSNKEITVEFKDIILKCEHYTLADIKLSGTATFNYEEK